MSSNRISSFDGLRAFAIIGVMLQHSPAIREVYSRAKYGWVGVDLFFVLSGYLITQILLQSKGTRGYYRNFFARRALRIWPLYMAVLTLVIFAIPALAKPRFWPVEFNPIYYYLFLQNLFADKAFLPFLSPTWSLVVEEQFYLIWPFMISLLTPKRLATICAAGLFLAPVLRFTMLKMGGTGNLNYSYTFTHMDGLLAGSLVAIVRPSLSGRRAGITASLAVIIGSALFVEEAMRTAEIYASLFAFTALALGFAGVLVLTLRSADARGWLARALGWKPLVYIGKISYGIYLTHEIAQWALMKSPVVRLANAVHPPALRVAIQVSMEIIAAVLLASVSWYGFEAPILRLKKRFETERALASVAGRAAI